MAPTDHAEHRQMIRDADNDLREAQRRIEKARKRLQAADSKYAERMRMAK